MHVNVTKANKISRHINMSNMLCLIKRTHSLSNHYFEGILISSFLKTNRITPPTFARVGIHPYSRCGT